MTACILCTSDREREREEQKEKEPDAASPRSADASPTWALAMEKQGTWKNSGLVEVCKYNESSSRESKRGGPITATKKEKKEGERLGEEREREREGRET